MSSSVAGQIRIDLIAQAAQFKTGLREGRQELGSFQEQFEKFNRAFNSQKSIAARIGGEKDAWGAAMKGLRGEIAAGGNSMLPWYSLERMNARSDRAEDNRLRFQSMIPWGSTLRTELTREAAETAALLGKEKQNLVREFAQSAQELAGAGMGAVGYGGIFGGAMKFAASPMGAATIGVTAVAGTIAHAVRERDQLAREVRMYALQFGSSSESASRLLGSGIDETSIARVQRSFSQKSEQQLRGFSALKINPDELSTMPVEKALLRLNDAFQKIPNAADRAYVAFELFGRGGYATLGTLQRMKDKIDLLGEREIIHAEDIERVKAWDRALNQAKDTIYELSLTAGKAFGTESGLFTHLARGIEILGPLLKGDMKGLDKKLFRYEREDFNIEHANRIAMLKAGVDRGTVFGMEGEYDAGRLTKAEYDERTSAAIDQMQEQTRRIEEEADKRDKVAKKFQDLNDKLFEMEYGSEALARVKFERDLQALGIRGGRDSAGVLHGPMAEYMDRYDAGVKWEKDRKAQQEAEKQHARELEHKEKQEADEAQEFFRRRDEFKNRLRSPQQIAREELRDLRDNRSNLTAEEYGRGRREIGEKLMGGMGGGEIQPVGMLEAGSAELHSLLAKANMPDPKIAIAQRMLVELEKIVAKLDAEDQL